MNKKYSLDTIFWLSEEHLKLWCSDVTQKGKRPYVMILQDDKHLVLIPTMSKIDKKGFTRSKKSDWIEVQIYNGKTNENIISYLMTDRKIFWHQNYLRNRIIDGKVEPSKSKAIGEINKIRNVYKNFYK